MNRWAPVAFTALLLLGPGASPDAAPADEALMPLEQYTTSKSRSLASAYRPQLVRLSERIYHCMPWADAQKHGIGFRKPKWAEEDERYLSVWIWIEQDEDASFAALPQARRASAMFSRYGVDMLRRMMDLDGVASDASVHGFSVVLSWTKPGTLRPGVRPVNETLALFIDRASGVDFLAKRLAAVDFTSRARLSFFDGQRDLGRPPLEVWDDPFLATFQLKDYRPPPGQGC